MTIALTGVIVFICDGVFTDPVHVQGDGDEVWENYQHVHPVHKRFAEDNFTRAGDQPDTKFQGKV